MVVVNEWEIMEGWFTSQRRMFAALDRMHVHGRGLLYEGRSPLFGGVLLGMSM